MALPKKMLAAAGASSLLLAACGGSTSEPGLSSYAVLGKKIFNDKNLSASGAQACSTCHNPNGAHAQINDLAVQLGGANLDQQGFRAPPSLNYLEHAPAFAFDAGNNPAGGFDRDGRAATLADQPALPLLASFEMANGSKAEVIARLQTSSYADDFRAVFGAGILNDPDKAFADLSFALQQYQIEDAGFHPYNSKYDLYLAAKVTLSAAESHGLALFNDPQKGNCSACHPSAPGAYGAPSAFTNYRYAAIGVPRNAAIPANDTATYFDLGACGPFRTDLSNRPDLCGAFKVPSLRNVATRKVFFHNGRFNDLTTAVTFLVQRDTNPASWYPTDAAGSVQIFDDLPVRARANVDSIDAPFNRKLGGAPALSAAEIADLVQFLGTLTDGYGGAP